MKFSYALCALLSACSASLAVGDPVPYACTLLQQKLCGHCSKDGGSSCWLACVRKHSKELRKVCNMMPEITHEITEAHLAILASPALAQDHTALRALVTEQNAANAIHHHDVASGAPNYVSYSTFNIGSTGCKPDDLLIKGASLVGSCININSTASTDYQCDGALACTAGYYGNKDCSGTAEQSIKIKTDGTCQEIKDPMGTDEGSVWMIAAQTSDGTKGLDKPIMSIYGDDACSTTPWAYTSKGRCMAFGDKSAQYKCAGDKLQVCNWQNSTTCPSGAAGGGKCFDDPMTGCTKIPRGNNAMSVKESC